MYIIGLDIGTTGTKALLVDSADGSVAGRGYCGYSLITEGDRVEQDATDWIKASRFAIQEAIRENEAKPVSAISISSQGASMAIVDESGTPIGNAITWMDSRARAEATELAQLLGNAYVYHMSGWRIFPTLDAAKILHLRHAGQDKPGHQYLSTIEIVNRYLTGNAVIDPTNAAIRQLMDIRTGRWDPRMLEVLGITPGQLPDIMPTGALVGGLTQSAARELGLPEGTPVYNGAHDQYCASIGAAAISAGDMLLSAGTTWVVLGLGKQLLYSESYIAPSIHPVSGLFGAIASLVGTGVSLEWYKNKFLPDISFDELDQQAQCREIGDLFYYPYPLGAGYPLWNTNAQAAFIGSNLNHDRFDYACAIMEGAAFGVRRALDDFSQNGCSIHVLKVLGGASKSPLWTRLICDITNTPVQLLQESDACALGAAIIAACGAGVYPDYNTAVAEMVHGAQLLMPSPEKARYYEEKYKRYCSAWDKLSAYYQ